MKRRIQQYILVTVCILMAALESSAQTFAIPDTNFIRYLKKAHPSVLDSQDKLIIAAAAAITHNINTPYYGIQNLDGVQYFINVPMLDIYRNNISFIPALDDLTKVTQILAMNNQLNTFPDISNLPDLNKLFLSNNNLSYLPEVNKNKNLTELHCHANKLISLPNVDSLVNLKSFHFGNNPTLTSIPDLTHLTELEHVYFFQCNVSAFPDISNNQKLKRIYAGYNKYSSLPDFSIYPDLDVVEVTYCNLTFEDLLPVTAYPGFDTIFKFFPQNKIGNEITLMKEELSGFAIHLNIDNSVSTNRYKWFKDGKLIRTTPVSSLEIDTIRLDDAGDYTCEITNSSPELAGITLYSNLIHLVVNNPCLIISDLKYDKKDISCNGTGAVLLDTSSISGGVKPYTYSLKNTFSELTIHSTDGNFQNLNDGNYTLEIRDKIDCIRKVSNIELTRKAERIPGDCKGLAITPDGDAINDTYFIAEPGEAKIYNSKGQLVKKLSTPAYWDGTNSNGQVIGDYYLIEINKDAVIHITVIY